MKKNLNIYSFFRYFYKKVKTMENDGFKIVYEEVVLNVVNIKKRIYITLSIRLSIIVVLKT